MNRIRPAVLAIALVSAPSALFAVPFGFTLGSGGTSLVSLGDLTGNSPLSSVDITDSVSGASVALSDIDFEIETGDLYGVSAVNDAVYLLDRLTGIATFLAGLPTSSAAQVLAIDWNNAIDRLRIVDTDGLNFVFNQVANTVTQFTSLGFVAGDVNAGAAPTVFANAYRDAIAGTGPEGGMQLGIDATTDSLVTVGNNAGTLTTVGVFDFDLTTVGGFDIFSTPDGALGFEDRGYALLTDASTGSTALYEIALAADGLGKIAATLLRDFGANADLRGFAVIAMASPTAPVPLPASLAMLGVAMAGLAGLRLRRREAA